MILLPGPGRRAIPLREGFPHPHIGTGCLTLGDHLMNRAYALALALVLATPSFADEVGQIATDWTGNDIIVDAIQDPKVQGVTCHLTYFNRGLLDRLRQGHWFEDPSHSSIACR